MSGRAAPLGVRIPRGHVIPREEQLDIAEPPNCRSVARTSQPEVPVLVLNVIAAVVLEHLVDVDAAQMVCDKGQQLTNVSAHRAGRRGVKPGEDLQRFG